MSDQTKIEWATHTFNPWIGCTKVSPGCAHCYAEVSTPARVLRKGEKETWGKGAQRQRTSVATWRNPVKWNRQPWQVTGFNEFRPRVFPSLCDWLDDEVPIEWLADFLKLIHDTPNLDWLLLTKRPENFGSRISKVWDGVSPGNDSAEGAVLAYEWHQEQRAPSNVWLGVSVEDQLRADERIPELLKIPAAVRFLSVEPLLGPVDLQKARTLACGNKGTCFPQDGRRLVIDSTEGGMAVECICSRLNHIHWVIIGGESGTGARPCNVEWIRDLVRQCKAAGVPCFVKQLGSNARADDTKEFGSTTSGFCRLELKHPKGGDPSEWPEDLRVREFPLSQDAQPGTRTVPN